MNADPAPRYRRRIRGRPGCDGSGRERGRKAPGGGNDYATGLVTRTTARALVTLGTCLAHDLRDAGGATRTILREAALRMVASRQKPLRRLGTAYLRTDPPTTRELPEGQHRTPAQSGRPEDDWEVIDVAPDDVAGAV